MNFEEAYHQYLEYVEIKQKNQSIRTLKERFNNIILPYFEGYNIYDIKEITYLAFQREIDSRDYSYNYKRNIHYLMSSFFDYCVKFLNLEYNVSKSVGCFRRINYIKNTNFYTVNEFNMFIKYIDNNVYKQFFNFMFFTGTRPGEAMALRFSDLNNSIISINKTIDSHYDKDKKCRIIGTPKTFSSIRDIEIDRKLNKDLLKLKKYYVDKYNMLDYDYFIFGGIKPLAPTTINRYKKIACEKANLKVIRLHDFRHSHATLLVDKKLMINEISRRLGHSNVSTTLNTYVHTNKEQEKRVIKTLNFLRL